jgi:SAM-dependent methyltransferase
MSANPDKLLLNTKWGRTGTYDSYDDVKNFFEIWAVKPDADVEWSESYDADLEAYYHGPRVISRLLLEHLAGEHKDILDVGCGTGLAGVSLLEAGHQLYGLDISKQMTELAGAKGYQQVATANVLADRFPWRRSFDALISAGVIGEWIPPLALFQQVLPHLRPDSVIAVTMEMEHSDLDEVVAYLADQGFSIQFSAKELGLEHPVYEEEYYFYLLASRGSYAIAKDND